MVTLAFPALIVSSLITGGLLFAIKTDYSSFWVPWLVGAITSATDPVAVVSLLKDLGAPKTLGTIIEGESLLNDGSAVVLFTWIRNCIGCVCAPGSLPLALPSHPLSPSPSPRPHLPPLPPSPPSLSPSPHSRPQPELQPSPWMSAVLLDLQSHTPHSQHPPPHTHTTGTTTRLSLHLVHDYIM